VKPRSVPWLRAADFVAAQSRRFLVKVNNDDARYENTSEGDDDVLNACRARECLALLDEH